MMSLFERKKIQFKEPFHNKYRLTILSDIQTGNMSIKTEAGIRWDINVHSISEDKIGIEVITLDNQLIDGNSPLIKNIANANQIFARIYSELDLVINNNAKILEIRNIELIKEKWSWVKNDLKEIQDQDPMIAHVINLNEAQIGDEQLLLDAINHNEFFSVYFHHLYGNAFHCTTDSVKSKNILNTILLKWDYRIDNIEKENQKLDTFKIEGFVETSTSKIKESYKAFSHLDILKLNPKITEEGKYYLDPSSGKIVKALLEKKEIVHPQLLYATIKYELEIE